MTKQPFKDEDVLCRFTHTDEDGSSWDECVVVAAIPDNRFRQWRLRYKKTWRPDGIAMLLRRLAEKDKRIGEIKVAM